MNLENFTGFVLAGGKSSRMKTEKEFLKTGDKTFLENAVETLSEVCEKRVKVVLNQSQAHFIEKLPAGISYIFDAFENRGAPGGIHAALKNCVTKYAIILAIDLPFVTAKTIKSLADITLSSNKFIAVVPRQTDGRSQPLCAVYHARYCLPMLENLLTENDSASVRDFLELVHPRFVDQNKLTANENENIFFNVNHPADFDKIKSEF